MANTTGPTITKASTATRAFYLNAVGTKSELHALADKIFSPIEDDFGGWAVLSGRALPHGRFELHIVAWAPEFASALLDEIAVPA